MTPFAIKRPAVAVAVVALLALPACGGPGSEASEVARIDDAASAPIDGAADADSGGEAAGSFQDAALEFAACLREQGLDVPDPDFSGDPGQGGGPGGGLFGESGIDPQDPEVQAAIEGCPSALGGIGGQFTPEDQAGRQDAILEFTACLREQGLDVPDPDFSGGPPQGGAGPDGPGEGGGFFGGAIDPDDPEVQAALEQCQGFLPGNPFQNDNGGGS